MNLEELAQLHKALSLRMRLKILRLITERSLCVNAITRHLSISQPAVSQHLAILRQTGLVRGDKQGYKVHYTLNRARLQELRQAMDLFANEKMPEPAGLDRKMKKIPASERPEEAEISAEESSVLE